MAYVGWPVNVNKIILEQTTIAIGNGATKDDTLETGKPKSKLSCTHPSNTYNVTMDFNWYDVGDDGYTEYQRFLNWYQYKLKYKVNYFEFPSILLGHNSNATEWYRITSAVEGQKSGYDVRVTMTWESSYEGIITVTEDDVTIDHISATNGYVDVILTGTPSADPTSNSWTFTINSTAETITGFAFDDEKTARIYFAAKTTAGTYKVAVDSATDSFVVS